jgi:hypothetical protein
VTDRPLATDGEEIDIEALMLREDISIEEKLRLYDELVTYAPWENTPENRAKAEAAIEAAKNKWLAEVQATIDEVARDWAENGVPAKRFLTADDLRAAAAQYAPTGRRKARRTQRADAPTLFREEDFDPEPPPAADDPV